MTAHSQILPLREQEKIANMRREKRLNVLLPRLLQRTGLDMWIVVSWESAYAERAEVRRCR